MRMMTGLGCLLAIAACDAFAGQEEIAKYDPRMALEKATVDTNGVTWIDGRYLPIEGRAFDDTKAYYDRLPANVTSNVNAGVRGQQCHTTGMQFRFRTDSKMLRFRWVPVSAGLSMDHMPSTGMSGIDVYRQDRDGKWWYVRTGRITDGVKGGSLDLGWNPGTPCLVNLPLYNGIRSFALGIDASCYVLDCLWNMGGVRKQYCDRDITDPSGPIPVVRTRYEPFLRVLRAARPDVPIVMAEHCNVFGNGKDSKDRFIRGLYEKLVAEGWRNLVYLPNDEMYTGDGEGTVDGCHPNNLGMQSMKNAFGKAIRTALQASRRGD